VENPGITSSPASNLARPSSPEHAGQFGPRLLPRHNTVMGTRASLMLLVALPALARAADLPTTETPVGRLALPVAPDSLVVSPDSSRLVFAAKAGETTPEDKGIFLNPKGTDPRNDSARPVLNPIRLYIDDKPTIPFDLMTGAVFSPDSKRLAFAGTHDKLWQLVLDGKSLLQDADNVPAAPFAFSPDSVHAAWVAEKGGQVLVTVDQQQWPPIDGGGMGMLTFSPDSRHLAAVLHTRGTWILYVDGVPLAPPVFAGAGTPAASRAATSPGASSTSSRAGTPANNTRLERFSQFTWRPDSSGLMFCAAFVGQPWQVFAQTLDGAFTYTSKPFDTVMKNPAAFSPDGRQFAFAASTRGKWAVVSDPSSPPTATTSRAAPPSTTAATAPASLDQILAESVVYCIPNSPTAPSPALIYLAQQNKKWRLYTDHRPSEEAFDAIVQSTFVVSPDRHHFAFAAVRDKQTVVIRDGTVVATHDETAGLTFAFSADSQHLAYGARNGPSWFACIDGTPGYPFTAIAGSAIAFSADSRRIAFAAATGTKDWHLVIGKDADLRSKAYDGFLKGSHVTWRADGTVVTIAIQKSVAARVEAKP